MQVRSNAVCLLLDDTYATTDRPEDTSESNEYVGYGNGIAVICQLHQNLAVPVSRRQYAIICYRGKTPHPRRTYPGSILVSTSREDEG